MNKRYVAEFIGTFVLVFASCGSAVIAGDKIGYLGVSLAFGFSLLCMAYAIGPVSGCHINPAVTIGALICKKIESRFVVGYIIAQILGALVASAILLLIVKGMPDGYDPSLKGFAANGYGEHSPAGYNLISCFLVEVVLSFFLVFTVLGTTDIKAPVGFAGIPIGLVLVLIHLVGIPVTNTSVNPARSIGPAIFVGGWALSQLWVFIIAPLLGAVIAAGVYLVTHNPLVVITVKKGEEALPSEQAEKRN
ncbi:MAG: aquaporin Z [Flavisolibacter sp.]